MITIITGSTRGNSQSEKVAKYIGKQLNEHHNYSDINILNLRNLALPVWSEENYTDFLPWQEISNILKASTAFVVITPEWDGMASPALKNFFLYCREKQLFHKPALLVAVSAGTGGSYPISELRLSSYKNTRLSYLPDHIIVRHVNTVLNGIHAISNKDYCIRKRISFALKMLQVYDKAFMLIREQSFLHDSHFDNGM